MNAYQLWTLDRRGVPEFVGAMPDLPTARSCWRALHQAVVVGNGRVVDERGELPRAQLEVVLAAARARVVAVADALVADPVVVVAVADPPAAVEAVAVGEATVAEVVAAPVEASPIEVAAAAAAVGAAAAEDVVGVEVAVDDVAVAVGDEVVADPVAVEVAGGGCARCRRPPAPHDPASAARRPAPCPCGGAHAR
jgi:hypothetical protein